MIQWYEIWDSQNYNKTEHLKNEYLSLAKQIADNTMNQLKLVSETLTSEVGGWRMKSGLAEV